MLLSTRSSMLNEAAVETTRSSVLLQCWRKLMDAVLWLQAKRTNYDKILVLSPDTNVYMIGLPYIL